MGLHWRWEMKSKRSCLKIKLLKAHLASFAAAIAVFFGVPGAYADATVPFTKKVIKINSVPLTVELADTPEKSSRGLMFRTELKEGTGMLFIFKDVDIRNFWMKNTFIPLSIGFFDGDRKLIDIQDMKPVKSEMEMNPSTYSSRAPAKFALEVPKGWFTRKKIKIGAILNFD
jgi:uncharacterized protein